MTAKQPTKHHLEFLSLKVCCTGSSESTLVKIPHCWKSHVGTHFIFSGSVPVSGSSSKVPNEKCLADELQEALIKSEHQSDTDDDVFLPNSKPLPKVYPKFSCNFLEELVQVKFNSVSKNTRAYLNSDNLYLQEDSTNVAAGFKEPPLVVDCKDICKDTSIAAECEEPSNTACGGCKEVSTDVVAECIEPLIAACGGRKDGDGDGKA